MPLFWKCKKKEEPKPKMKRGIAVVEVDNKVYKLSFEVTSEYDDGCFSVRYIDGGNSHVYSMAPAILNESQVKSWF